MKVHNKLLAGCWIFEHNQKPIITDLFKLQLFLRYAKDMPYSVLVENFNL
jgi:hypothetical protein